MMTPIWDPKNPEVPVDADGNWQHYPSSWNGGGTFVSAAPFPARMRFVDMCSGRSAKYLILEDEAGKTYPMFITDLLTALQHFDIVDGVMEAYWTGAKRGANYGVKVVKP